MSRLRDSGSQMRITLSLPPVTRRLPSREYARLKICEGWARCSGVLCADAFEQRREFGQGVVDTCIAVELAGIVDQVTAHFLVIVINFDERKNLRW